MLRRRRIGSHLAVERSLMRTSPSTGISSPLMSLRVVVLPEPLRPSKTRVSPWLTASDTFSSRGRPFKLKETRSNSIAVPLLGIPLLAVPFEVSSVCVCGIGAGFARYAGKHEMPGAIARSGTRPDQVRTLRQSCDPKTTMTLVPDVEADKQRGDLLDGAGVLKFTAVEGADFRDCRR